MTLTEAAAAWVEAKRQLDEITPRLDEAAKILKEHFRRTGRSSYKGVGYTVTTYRALDTSAARLALGPKVRDVEVDRQRETLFRLTQSAKRAG